MPRQPVVVRVQISIESASADVRLAVSGSFANGQSQAVESVAGRPSFCCEPRQVVYPGSFTDANRVDHVCEVVGRVSHDKRSVPVWTSLDERNVSRGLRCIEISVGASKPNEASVKMI